MQTQKILKNIRSYLFITIGLCINSLGWTGFLIPSELIGGGVTGVASLAFFATDFPIGYSVLIVNAVLILIAIRTLGAQFGITTIYSIAVISGFFVLFQNIITEPIVKDQFMSSLIGGALAGIGAGITFINGGNTGGTDIIALIINKYRNVTPGKIILYIDVVIIASSFILFQSIEKIVYGYVVMVVISYTIDIVIEGDKQSYQIMVFSKENQAIAERIAVEVGRGVTLLHGYGWFTKKESDVLIVISRKIDKQQIMRIIKECDKNAFISVTKTMGVYGQNFDKIKI